MQQISLSCGPKKRKRFKFNVTYVVILSILITFIHLFIGYRFEDILRADANITYYSDIKKGIINLKIFDNDRENFPTL